MMSFMPWSQCAHALCPISVVCAHYISHKETLVFLSYWLVSDSQILSCRHISCLAVDGGRGSAVFSPEILEGRVEYLW